MNCQRFSRSIACAMLLTAGLVFGVIWLNRASAKPGLVEENSALPNVTGQPLTADQLAGMLHLNAWSLSYQGGLIQCWLEIDEVGGKKPMKRRVPDEGYIGYTSDMNAEVLKKRPTEGTILFWWSKNSDGNGGSINLNVGNVGSYGLGLDNDAFTFGWKSFGANSTSIGKQPPIVFKPGEEVVLVHYDAHEGRVEGSKEAPREVHLKLKAKFLEPSL